jgi:hypothetical protein
MVQVLVRRVTGQVAPRTHMSRSGVNQDLAKLEVIAAVLTSARIGESRLAG